MTHFDPDRDQRTADMLAQFLTECRSGRTVDLAVWQTDHPDCAEDLPALLETLHAFETAVEDWKSMATLDAAPRQVELPFPSFLGRYRLVERLGSGGM